MIDGVPVDIETADWEMLEVAAFVNIDGEEIQRSYGMWLTDEYLIYGELFPTLNADAVYFTEPGDEVHFKMHNHATGEDYTATFGTIWNDGMTITIITGEEHWEGFDDPDHPLLLSFTGGSAGIEKEIVGYDSDEVDDQWYFLSSPVGTIGVTEENVSNLVGDFLYDFYAFDQSAEDGMEWRNFEAGSFTEMEVGKAYLYARQETGTITFNGTAYTGEGTFELEYDENAEMKGWNLMGNPYNENVTVDIESFYVMQGAEITAATNNSLIEPMQGILIEAEGEGQTVTFTPAEGGEKRPMLSLNLRNGRGLVDRAIIRFGQGGQLHKYQLREESTKLYIPMDGSDYAVVNATEMGEMPVNFKAKSNGSYTLSVNAEEVSFGYLHLIDNMTGADTDLLSNPSYTFEARTTDYANRFKLVFATGNADEIFAFFSNGSFVINNEGIANVQVIDVTGRILNSETINGCANVSVNAAPGVYMLRLVNGDNVKVQKVVVR